MASPSSSNGPGGDVSTQPKGHVFFRILATMAIALSLFFIWRGGARLNSWLKGPPLDEILAVVVFVLSAKVIWDGGTSLKAWLKVLRLDHILAVVAIVLSIKAIWDVQQFRQDFLDEKKRIDDIASYVSTRYLPDWPGHSEYLSTVVATTGDGDSLVIVLDGLGYLHFTDPQRFGMYWNDLIQAARKGKSIRILLRDEVVSRKSLWLQFKPGGKNDYSKVATDVIAHYRSIYQKQLSNTNLPTRTLWTRDQFLDAVQYVENDLCRELIDNHVEVRAVKAEEVRAVKTETEKPDTSDLSHELNRSMFFWLSYRDAGSTESGKPSFKQMVFAYPRFYGAQTGYAFHSQDPHLMEEFLYEFEQKWNDSRIVRTVGRQGKDELFPDVVRRLAAPARGQQNESLPAPLRR